jgi:hypothetical protein
MIKIKKYADVVYAFNSKMKALVDRLAKVYPNDDMIYRTKNRIMAISSYDPLTVVNTVGPYLYYYRNQIFELENNINEFDFFVKNNFEREFGECYDTEMIEFAQMLMMKIKQYVTTVNAEVKKEYIGLVIAMLDDYIEYIDVSQSDNNSSEQTTTNYLN